MVWYYRCTDLADKGLPTDGFVASRATFSRCKSETGKFKEVGAFGWQSRRDRPCHAGAAGREGAGGAVTRRSLFVSVNRETAT